MPDTQTAEWREELAGELEKTGIPDYMHASLLGYICERHPVGTFLRAVLSNDLFGAACNADEQNEVHLRDYVLFLHNHAPSGCWGSAEHYSFWTTTKEPK